MQKKSFSFTEFADKFPPTITRSQVGKHFKGLLSSGMMARLDSLGKGPKQKEKVGKVIVYKTESLLEWLDSRMK